MKVHFKEIAIYHAFESSYFYTYIFSAIRIKMIIKWTPINFLPRNVKFFPLILEFRNISWLSFGIFRIGIYKKKRGLSYIYDGKSSGTPNLGFHSATSFKNNLSIINNVYCNLKTGMGWARVLDFNIRGLGTVKEEYIKE